MMNEVRTQVKINQNSHTAAMCETQHPTLCGKHLQEVVQDGDLLKKLGESDAECDMCKAEAAV